MDGVESRRSRGSRWSTIVTELLSTCDLESPTSGQTTETSGTHTDGVTRDGVPGRERECLCGFSKGSPLIWED